MKRKDQKKIQSRIASTRPTRKPGATAGKRLPKPKTAYELLQRVCEAMRAKPLSYYQGAWCLFGKRDLEDGADFTQEQVNRNACGTAFCRAGWIVAVADGAKAVKRLEESAAWPPPVAERANWLLDMGSWDTEWLFDGNAVKGQPGTRAYVNEGVRGVRDFMKEHAAHLKARSLRGV